MRSIDKVLQQIATYRDLDKASSSTSKQYFAFTTSAINFSFFDYILFQGVAIHIAASEDKKESNKENDAMESVSAMNRTNTVIGLMLVASMGWSASVSAGCNAQQISGIWETA